MFAGGDVVTGPSTVIAAIAAGKQAAAMIDRYVTGKLMKVLPKVKLPIGLRRAVSWRSTRRPAKPYRLEPPHARRSQQRKRCFAEVELCPTEEQALREARRCLRCDLDFTQPLTNSSMDLRSAASARRRIDAD